MSAMDGDHHWAQMRALVSADLAREVGADVAAEVRYARGMAELDYAYLADYAAVENGRLTAVGASYTHARVSNLDGAWLTAIAGRVRTKVGAAAVALKITIGPEDQSFRMIWENELLPDPDARPYGEGTVGVLFAALISVPLLTAGRYVCEVQLDDVPVRVLVFTVEVENEASAEL